MKQHHVTGKSEKPKPIPLKTLMIALGNFKNNVKQGKKEAKEEREKHLKKTKMKRPQQLTSSPVPDFPPVCFSPDRDFQGLELDFEPWKLQVAIT